MSTISQVGIYGVGTGILHPKHKNRFRVLFTGMGAAANGGATTSIPNDLSLQVVNVTLPTVEFEEVQLDRYNSRAYVAGKHTISAVELTVEDDVTNRAMNAIISQLERQQRLIGANGPWLNTEMTASTYKFGMIIDSLDGNETVVESYKCEGGYISNYNPGDLDYSTGEKRTISLTIRIDHFRQILTPGLTGSAIGGIVAV